MPTLYKWFAEEYSRLRVQGKTTLVEDFDAYRQGFFDYKYHQVCNAVPNLYALTDSLNEPAIRLAVDYYRASIESYWLGNLANGLDIATRAVVRLKAFETGYPILGHFMQLSLIRIWLNVDGPGYVPDCLALIDEVPDGLPKDYQLRLEIIKASTLMRGGEEQRAFEMINGILPQLGYDWPQSYRYSIRGESLYRIGRLEDSLEFYEKAVTEFENSGHQIYADDAGRTTCDILTELGQGEKALERLKDIETRVLRSRNKAHPARIKGARGRAYASLGRVDEAVDCFTQALEGLDGLGWLRKEASLALARLEADQGKTLRSDWVADARARVARLRSTDLADKLDEVLR